MVVGNEPSGYCPSILAKCTVVLDSTPRRSQTTVCDLQPLLLACRAFSYLLQVLASL